MNYNYGRYWYPGVENRHLATAVSVLPGQTMEGIEVQIAKVRTVAIRGRINSPLEVGDVYVNLNQMQITRLGRGIGIIARGKFKAGEGFQVDNLLPGTLLALRANSG